MATIPRVKIQYKKGVNLKYHASEMDLANYVDHLVIHNMRSSTEEDGVLERVKSECRELSEMFARLVSLLIQRNVLRFEDLDNLVGSDYQIESVTCETITAEKLTPECGDGCLHHADDCDGHCDHDADHVNMCLVPKPRTPVTILELATYRLGRSASTGQDFDDADLPIMGGCEICGATVSAYNACPSKTGNIRCKEGCIADLGYVTVQEANRAVFDGVMPIITPRTEE